MSEEETAQRCPETDAQEDEGLCDLMQRQQKRQTRATTVRVPRVPLVTSHGVTGVIEFPRGLALKRFRRKNVEIFFSRTSRELTRLHFIS